MARTKLLNVVVVYGGTNLVVNDLGETKTPRFELYDTAKRQVIKKSDNPLEFYKIIETIWASQRGKQNV